MTKGKLEARKKTRKLFFHQNFHHRNNCKKKTKKNIGKILLRIGLSQRK